MSRRSNKFLKAALSALHYTRADDLIAPFTAGRGVIFMLHHVTPQSHREFDPNRILKISPEFLDAVLKQVGDAGFDFIGMDEVPGRLKDLNPGRPFACFTLDDGYRDNRDYALPVFKRHNVPFTIYVPSDFGDGKGDLWWLVLEEALRRLSSATLDMNGTRRTFDLLSAAAKDHAFHEIYWWLRGLPEDRARAVTHRLARDAGYDASTLCRDLVMNWDELRAFANDPLVSIGAHTNAHYALSKLEPEQARREIVESIAKIEKEMGAPCRHFSYPYGCELSAGEREFEMVAELGLATAVTTRKGLLHAADAGRLNALPRFSLNGDFQDPRYIKVLLSGAPFAVWKAFQRWSTPAPSQAG
jgi:peptidoglycan/xylan/chitin deacetylase (PgdA/CDA1 family)